MQYSNLHEATAAHIVKSAFGMVPAGIDCEDRSRIHMLVFEHMAEQFNDEFLAYCLAGIKAKRAHNEQTARIKLLTADGWP